VRQPVTSELSSDLKMRGFFNEATWWLARCPTARGFLVQIPAGALLCGVCMFSPCMTGFSPGTPTSSHPKHACNVN